MRRAFRVEAQHFLDMLALMPCRAFAAARVNRQLCPAVAANERDREMGVEEELLQILGSDRGDVLEGLQFAPLSLQDDAVRLRIGIGEANAPLITAAQECFAFLVDLRGLRRSWFCLSERCGRRDGHQIAGIVEGENDRTSHRRLAGDEQRRERHHKEDSFQTSSRIAAIGSRRDAARAGYQVASTDSAMATRLTPVTSSASTVNGR